jgi:diacylglycerol kinase (ATP)
MPRQSIALIANPGSRSADPDAVAARLRAEGAQVQLFEVGDFRRAAASGASRLVVAGGDGTVAPAAAAAAAAGIPLAVLPLGTANDFASGVGLPDDVERAAHVAVRGGRLRALELGWMERPEPGGRRRPFVNVASLGLPGPAARRAGSFKRALGPFAYFAGAVAAGLTSRPVSCRASCDDRLVHEGPAWQLTVACTGAFGAGSRIEHADPLDGELDVVAMEAGSRLRLVGLAYGLRRGGLGERPGVSRDRGRRIDVDAPAGTAYNVDGELVRHGSARFTVEARAFELVTG